MALQYLKGAQRNDGKRRFTRAWSDRRRGNGITLAENRVRWDVGKKFFSVRVERH